MTVTEEALKAVKPLRHSCLEPARKTFDPLITAHLEDEGSLKQLVFLNMTFACSLEPGLSGWIWSHFHLLSSSHGCDEGLQHHLRLQVRFRRRNCDSQHISVCLPFFISALSVRDGRICTLVNAQEGTV